MDTFLVLSYISLLYFRPAQGVWADPVRGQGEGGPGQAEHRPLWQYGQWTHSQTAQGCAEGNVTGIGSDLYGWLCEKVCK